MKIGFLGSGNMARSLGHRLKTSAPNIQQYFYSPSGTKARQLAVEVQGTFVASLDDFPNDMDILFLAFKPQMLNEAKLPKISTKTIIVSLLAAISIEKLEAQYLDQKIVRLMPNTPSEIGLGVLPYVLGNKLIGNSHDQVLISQLLSFFGQGLLVEKDQDLEILTPYTGCLPGMLYYFFDLLQKDLKTNLDQHQVHSLKDVNTEKVMMNVIKGIVDLYFHHKTLKLHELQAQVTSKGGLTEQAILSLKNDELEKMIRNSIESAMIRSSELNKLINQ